VQTPNNPARRRRIAFVAALAASLAALFTVLGGAGLAQGLASAAQYQYGKKSTICHKGKTIRVATASWKGHQRHGDTQGPCVERARPKSKGHGKAEARDEESRTERAEKREQADQAEKAEKPEKPEKVEQADDDEEVSEPEERQERGNGNGRGRGRG
jgi:hypothetical protein